MIYNHSRWQIWAQLQHPYKHVLSDIAYANAALPGANVVNAQQALDWIVTVVYPQTKPAVANAAALPTVGNTINDYRIVNDDGAGKAAAYRWLQTEGMAAPAWVKLYEMDWGVDSILEQATNVAQGLFVKADGHDDVDGTNTPIAGTYAGQRVVGGASAGTNLTLTANGGDGAGAHTGFVQSDNTVRPTASGSYDLGTATVLWRDAYLSGHAYIGTMTLAGGSILDSSGSIDFGSTHLQTSGTVYAGTANSLHLGAGSITDTSGAISFGADNLTTTGAVNGGTGVFTGSVTADHVVATGSASTFETGTTVGTLTLANGSITDSGAAISFGADTLTTTGNVSFGQITGTKLSLTGTTSFVYDPATATTTIGAAGAGTYTVAAAALNAPPTSATTFTASSKVTTPELDVGTSVLLAQSLTWTGSFTMTGTTLIHSVTTVEPHLDAATALGVAALRYTNLFLSGGVSDGTNTVPASALTSLRSINVGVADGDVLQYSSATGTWLPKTENTSIDHHLLMNLTSGDDHTQYAFLAGRVGGQTLTGDTAASGNLTLSSTANVTKGFVETDSTFIPTASASFDLGSGTKKFRNLYLSGTAQLALAAGGGSVVGVPGETGQLWYNTTTLDVWLDDGSGTNYLRKISLDKYYYQDAATWNGTQTTVTYTVSQAGAGTSGRGWVSDARACVWALKDNANSFKQVLCDITATQTTVTVTVDMALPAGTYTLIGVG